MGLREFYRIYKIGQDLHVNPEPILKILVTKPAGHDPASFGIVPRQFGCRQ
jgi:hypothetical protein